MMMELAVSVGESLACVWLSLPAVCGRMNLAGADSSTYM